MKNRLSPVYAIIPVVAIILLSCEKNADFGKGRVEKIKPNDRDMIGYVSQPVCGGELHADLFAGKNTRVGEVIVTLRGSMLKVRYVADDGWVFSETHLSVTNSLEEVPAGNGGNPMTGLFKYHSVHKPAVTGYLYDIQVDNAGELYILAHAEVRPVLQWKTSLTDFSLSIPDTAVMKVDYPVVGSSSYLKATITNGGILDGIYNCWCIDVDNVIYGNKEYLVRVISSYDQDFSNMNLVENPLNIDRVNWIINQDFPGKTAPDNTVYTYGDVQRAIWELLDDNYSESGLGPWSQQRVSYILAMAAGAGQSYMPRCGEKIAVILFPLDMTRIFQITMAQVVLTEFPAACEPVCGNSETAWAAGYDFGGSNWAKYFTFCVER